MDGREQVNAYRALYHPDQLADPLLILEGPGGREIKAGWRAVSRVSK